jgi:hypothetical protein
MGRFPTTWDWEKFGCRLIDDILGGDAVQLLGGVPKNVIRCLERWWLLHVVHAASGCFQPWPLRVIVVPLLVIVPTLARVLRVVFKLYAHIPLASLTMSLGSCVLALLPR